MIRSVTWISESDLPCDPTANVILCTDNFTINAQLTNRWENSCPGEFVFQFNYEEDDLPAGYVDSYGLLANEDVNEVLCKDCWTQWVQEQLKFTFANKYAPGNNAIGSELDISGNDPLVISGGDGIEVAFLQPDQLLINLEISTDDNNQIIIGSDSNPYVAPSLYLPDGWYTVSNFAGWSYASANTINVPAGALNIYAKGDKIKIIQLGSPKYFYVVALSDTVLTVQAGADYLVSNNDIQAAYYSKDLSPVGFPSSFNFSTTITGFSVLPSSIIKKFDLIGRKATIFFTNAGAQGTSNGTGFTLTIPLISEAGGPKFINGGNQGYDNGVYQDSVMAELPAGSATITLVRNGGSTWTASGNKSASFMLSFLI